MKEPKCSVYAGRRSTEAQRSKPNRRVKKEEPIPRSGFVLRPMSDDHSNSVSDLRGFRICLLIIAVDYGLLDSLTEKTQDVKYHRADS